MLTGIYRDNIKNLEDEKQIKITLEDIGGEE